MLRLAAVVFLVIVAGCAGTTDPPAKRDAGPVLDASTMEGEVTPDNAQTRRQRANALYRSAKRELERGHYRSARRLAIRSRQVHRTRAARTLLTRANAGIAKAAAAARERERLARIARDAKTCSAAEKDAVRSGAATPPGCARYKAEHEAKKSEPNCDSNYEGACLKPDSPDYDCAGGSGDGPDYTGPVRSVGSDPYDLDRDGDGYACESS